MTDFLHSFFSHFCGQAPHRCFWLGGEVLPVCQRCLGVYCGLLIGALAVPGAFGRSAIVPGWPGRAAIGVAIAAMVVMGFHLIDPGPIARFVGGCAFGAALSWLALPVAKCYLTLSETRSATPRETVIFVFLVCIATSGFVAALKIDQHVLLGVFRALAAMGWVTAFGLTAALLVGVLSKSFRGRSARHSEQRS